MRWRSFTAYYNAGTAALVFLLVAICVGVSLWCRLRRRRIQLSREQADDAEENIPLLSTAEDSDELEPEHTQRKRKGKGQEIKIDEGTPIFDVGEVGGRDVNSYFLSGLLMRV